MAFASVTFICVPYILGSISLVGCSPYFLQQLCPWLMLDPVFEVSRKVLVHLVERNIGFWEKYINENSKPEIKKRIRPLCACPFDGPSCPCPQRRLLSQTFRMRIMWMN
jgi:hypothetical protein